MHINIVDTRNIAVVVGKPAQGTYWNWAKGAFEAPFSAANHARAMTPVEAAPSIWSKARTAEIGDVLLNEPTAVPYFVVLDGAGNMTDVVDQWTSPSPVPYPVSGGGYSR